MLSDIQLGRTWLAGAEAGEKGFLSGWTQLHWLTDAIAAGCAVGDFDVAGGSNYEEPHFKLNVALPKSYR